MAGSTSTRGSTPWPSPGSHDPTFHAGRSSGPATTPWATTATTSPSGASAGTCGADLAEGSIDEDGCLVCPWHQSKYDVTTGEMVRGPQGVFAKIPGLGAAFVALTKVWPLRRGSVIVEGDELRVE